jgi:hypothetical protein
MTDLRHWTERNLREITPSMHPWLVCDWTATQRHDLREAIAKCWGWHQALMVSGWIQAIRDGESPGIVSGATRARYRKMLAQIGRPA